MKRSTILLLLLGAVCAVAMIRGLVNADKKPIRTSDPAQKHIPKRVVKFEKQIAAVGEPDSYAW